MIVDDVILLVVPIVTLVITVTVISHHLVQLKRLNNQIDEASEVVEGIVIELRNRLDNQDKKMVDHEVKLEILELKVSQFLQQHSRRPEARSETSREKKAKETEEYTFSEEDISVTKNLTKTEKDILQCLSKKAYTTTDLQKIIGKTREHTARVLKKLFQGGYVRRNETTRPYVYHLIRRNTISEST